MIRYYFDIVIDDDVTVDEEGELLLDVGSARQEAARTLAEIARDHLLLERTIAHLSIIVLRAEFARSSFSGTRSLCSEAPRREACEPS